jgi:hypothetical protein
MQWLSFRMTEERLTIGATVRPFWIGRDASFLSWRNIVWSNFEIGDLDLWRGEAYSKFFEHLDEQGGFYYEV